MADPVEGPAPAPLFLDQTEARGAEKVKAPPLSEGLDPPLICDMWEESWFLF